MKYILSYILCWLHSKSSLRLYVWTSRVNLQWSRLAAHQTIFWNLVLITDDELRSAIKHLWSPIPPLCGRMCTLTHLIPVVAYTASIGMTPSLNVGGMCMLLQPKHCSLKLRSACARGVLQSALCTRFHWSLPVIWYLSPLFSTLLAGQSIAQKILTWRTSSCLRLRNIVRVAL